MTNFYSGIWEGIVENVTDPTGRGRIKVRVPSLGPSSEDGSTDFISIWYQVIRPWGGSGSPDVGMTVPIIFGEHCNDASNGYVLFGEIVKVNLDDSPKTPPAAQGTEVYPTDLGTVTEVFDEPLEPMAAIDPAISGEGKEVNDLQSGYVASAAYPKTIVVNRYGLSYEFDPDSGRIKLITPKGIQVEFNDGGVRIKSASSSRVVMTSEYNAVYNTEYTTVGRDRFVKIGGTDTTRASKRRAVIGRDVATLSKEDITVNTVSKKTVRGARRESYGFEYTRSVGGETRVSTLREERVIGDKRIQRILGAKDPASLGVADLLGITSDFDGVEYGDTVRYNRFGDREYYLSLPGTRVKFGFGAPEAKFYTNPALSLPLVPQQFALMKGAFILAFGVVFELVGAELIVAGLSLETNPVTAAAGAALVSAGSAIELLIKELIADSTRYTLFSSVYTTNAMASD